MGQSGDRAPGQIPDRVPAGADCRQPGLAQSIEHPRQRAELQVVELDRLAGRQLAGAPSVLVRELAHHAQLLGRHPARGQLDPEHEGADLRLVVVEAPPLEPDEILFLDVGVARRDQRRQLTHHREWALLPLQALDGIALEHELQRRGFLQDFGGALCHAVPPSRKREGAPIPEPWTVPTAPALRHLPGGHPGWAARGWSSHLTDDSSRLRRFRRARSLFRS